MTENKQNVYNEKDNPYSSFITTRYYAEADSSSLWNHREIEYNTTGVPVLKLYLGETKKVFKEIYVDGVKTDLIVINKTLNDIDAICKITETGDTNCIAITANNIGTFVITPEMTGTLQDSEKYSNINDTNLIVIVEKEPAIIELKWGCQNPLILSNKEKVKIRINAIYDNGQSYEISNELLEQIVPLSSNVFAVDVNKEATGIYITPKNYDERCQIKITASSESLKELINNLDLLTIVTVKEIKPELLLSANFKVEYEKELILIDIDDTYNIEIYGIYEISDGTVIKHNMTSIYALTSDDTSIISINEYVLKPISVNTTVVTATNNVTSEFSVIPNNIIWNVRVIKTLSNVTWSINKLNLSIGIDEAIISVIATYTDGTSEDISNNCTFSYDDSLVNIIGNKIIPVNPGTTEISILSSFENGNIHLDDVYTITIVQPIKNIDIINAEKIVLDETELSLSVGDKMKLSYKIYPENATPLLMIWRSSNEDIVKVDNEGNIEVLNEGRARIYVGLKSSEYVIDEFIKNDNTTLDEIDLPEQYIKNDTTNDSELDEEYPDVSYSSIYSYCDIDAYAISVTGIKCVQDEIILYIDDDWYEIDVNVLPENATNKKLSWTFVSDSRINTVAVNSNKLEVKPQAEGSGILTVASIDNPDIKLDITIKVIDNRVKKINISSGNDDKYEQYHSIGVSPELELYSNIGDESISKIENNESWHKNDFSRFYCPINNSLQLSASVEPSGATNPDLIWYSSNGEFVKCTPTGIITPILFGRKPLNIEAGDYENMITVVRDNKIIQYPERFPDTVWVTAYNKKSKKSKVCQVRVTRNNITGFSISGLNNQTGTLDLTLWRDETVIVPMTIFVQDSNFGPSNNFDWNGDSMLDGVSWTDIVQLSNHIITHNNTENEFDWSLVSPSQVNLNKKNLNVNIKGIGLGSTNFYAYCDDPYYEYGVNSYEDTTDENGNVKLGPYEINVTFIGAVFTDNITSDLMDEHFDLNLVKIRDIPVSNAQVKMINDNYCSIVTPNIKIGFNDNNAETYDLIIDQEYSDRCNKIIATIKKNGEILKDMFVIIESYDSIYTTKRTIDKTNELGIATNPTTNKYHNGDIPTEIIELKNAEEKFVPNSNNIHVTVVDSPNDIFLTFESTKRIKNRGLPQYHGLYEQVWTEYEVIKILNSSYRSVPLFIRFDDNFTEDLYNYSKHGECPVDDKYLSFAWFTSDPNVFIPIEANQVLDERDKVDIKVLHKKYDKFLLRGYGRAMNIQPTGLGSATLTIVNIMSGKTWERKIEVVEE